MKVNGKEIGFFKDYDALAAFLTGEMGWEQEEGGVLPNLKEYGNFVVLANKEHGILIAPNVAQFVAMEGNALYDQTAAAREAHTLVTEPGRCPADLIRYGDKKICDGCGNGFGIDARRLEGSSHLTRCGGGCWSGCCGFFRGKGHMDS